MYMQMIFFYVQYSLDVLCSPFMFHFFSLLHSSSFFTQPPIQQYTSPHFITLAYLRFTMVRLD